MLEVTNPQADVDYTWKLDNSVIGYGPSISYLVASNLSGTKVLRCSATPHFEDACRKEAFDVKSVSIGSIPATPYITVNTKDALCGGTAILTANFAGVATAYNWFVKNGNNLTFVASTGTNPNYTVTQTGEYAVSVVSGGCSSSISGSKTIVASDFGTITWMLQPSTANVGETKTFAVQVTPDYKTSYFWTVTGGTITNGQGTNAISVSFPTATTVTVSVVAENACGVASGMNSTQVVVSSGCTPPVITQNSGTDQTISAGSIANMSVTVTGTPPYTYQWYAGSAGTTTSPLSGQTNSSFSTTLSQGTYTFWCKVSNACGSVNSEQFTIVAKQNPALIPTGAGTLSGRTLL